MLLLTRRLKQRIMIGDDIIISVNKFFTDNAGRQVAEIGIIAPENINIVREEIYNKHSNIDNNYNK